MNEYCVEFQNGMEFESNEGVCDNVSLDLEYQIHPENDENKEDEKN